MSTRASSATITWAERGVPWNAATIRLSLELPLTTQRSTAHHPMATAHTKKRAPAGESQRRDRLRNGSAGTGAAGGTTTGSASGSKTTGGPRGLSAAAGKKQNSG